MTGHGLDELARTLQATVDNGQEKIKQLQTELLSKVINTDKDGRPEFLTWECRLPSGFGGDRTYEILRLPLASIYPHETMAITELSVEIDCLIKKAPRNSAFVTTRFTAIPAKPVKSGPKQTHRIKLKANRQLNDSLEVTVDDNPLEEFLEHATRDSSFSNVQINSLHNPRMMVLYLFASIAILAALIAYHWLFF